MVKKLIKRLMMLLQVLRQQDLSSKVFFYHDVGKKYTNMGTSSSLFWRHMDLLHGSPKTMSCHQVCFDDGFRGIWDEREEFRKRGIHPIVFVAIRLVGLPNYLTWNEIRTLQNDYGFEFQCHTWSHQTLVGAMIEASPKEDRTESWYARELVESRKFLEKEIGRAVTAICFPVGNFSNEVVDRCKAAGYEKVYASYPGNMTKDYIRPRNLVQDFCVIDFRLALRGGMMAFFNRYYAAHKF